MSHIHCGRPGQNGPIRMCLYPVIGPAPLSAALLGTARDAFTQAFVAIAAVNAAIILATAIGATLMLRQRQSVRTG
jgi:hypothetical protein